MRPDFYTLRLFPDGNEYYCEYDWGPAFDNDETSKRYNTAMFLAIIAEPIYVVITVYATIAWSLKRRHSQRKMMSVSPRSCGYQQNMPDFPTVSGHSNSVYCLYDSTSCG